MLISESKIINADKEDIWRVITDIEGAKERISCIKELKLLEKPSSGLVGTKWEETREFMGKDAVETMWITQAEELSFYETRAENCGCIYTSRMSIEDTEKGNLLSMSFSSKPQTLMAKLSVPLMWIFSGSLKKAIQKDLLDIKNSLEANKS